MIKPGDYIVLTGEGFKEDRFKIKQVSKFIYLGRDLFFKDDDTCYGVYYDNKGYQGYEIQRIQDYFEPGDIMETVYNHGEKKEWVVVSCNGIRILCENDMYLDAGETYNIKSIRNLTKEGKMITDRVNPMIEDIIKENSFSAEKKEKPTHLTAKELLEKDACEPGFQKFVARFGKSVNLKDSALKEWFNQNPYKSWLENNLPEHYAVIFEPEWTLKKNDYIFIEGYANDIARVYCIDDRITVIFHDGKKVEYEKGLVKPISERPFQVGDWVDGLDEKNGKRGCINTQEFADYCNANKHFYELIISPAIPEVK